MVFTPIESGVGGLLVGLSAALAYLVDGKITGISGILGPFLRAAFTRNFDSGCVWKGLFLLGLIIGGCANLALNRDHAFPNAQDFSPLRYAIAGLAVGAGTRAGRGCTSGHGICGLPRFSLRSWIAVPCFMAVAAATVAITRHGLKVDDAGPWEVAQLQWPPKWQFPLGSVIASGILSAASIFSPVKVQKYLTPLSCGIIFGLGLGCSGMTSQAKVLDFLDFGGTWDPSLAFVMGCGLCVSFPVYFWSERGGQGKERTPLAAEKFEKPPKYGNYGTLIFGATSFGLGWGLIGICPGPAVAGFVPYAAEGYGNGLSFGLCFLMMVVGWLSFDYVHNNGERLLAKVKVSSQSNAGANEGNATEQANTETDLEVVPTADSENSSCKTQQTGQPGEVIAVVDA
eukprot:TRINITY_DN11483_c0_g1_i2.p1 TRINITY_DN11483_c0_g1~~TRINITY_DN11483_c0_g1_i2.p1  ORF type:complete len:399 (-),score=85.54 TRINITY_DN11483_c0_g1_i2:70-1266(-)